MDAKKIDKLFQKQLKHLEETPNSDVWSAIESKLEKKNKRLIPFWWFASGGVAALFILGLFVFPFSEDEKKDKKINDSKIIITEVDTTEGIEKPTTTKEIDSIKTTTKKEDIIVVITENTTKETQREKKKLVSTKNAMKKFFLADKLENKNSNLPNKDEKKNITIQKREIDKNSDTFEKNKTKEKKPKKVDIEKELKTTETILKQNQKKSKWTVAPVFGLLSSNSLSKASPLNENLSSSTRGQNSFSYGVQVGFKINSKWTIQSGIHLQETSFRNNNIPTVLVTSRATSVRFENNTSSASATNDIIGASGLESNSFASNASIIGNLTQNYGYIEIPIEVKYNFYNTKKFTSEVVGGFSSLFLNQNNVNFDTQFLSNSLEATNLNSINFSGNLGLDFNYFMNKNLSFYINPMFKAQLNTFNENSNGFLPFNIGFYTGIKYQF